MTLASKTTGAAGSRVVQLFRYLVTELIKRLSCTVTAVGRGQSVHRICMMAISGSLNNAENFSFHGMNELDGLGADLCFVVCVVNSGTTAIVRNRCQSAIGSGPTTSKGSHIPVLVQHADPRPLEQLRVLQGNSLRQARERDAAADVRVQQLLDLHVDGSELPACVFGW